MQKSTLYTGTGDKGLTSLVGGQRVAKNSARLEAYGTIDELSAFLGVVLSHPTCPDHIKTLLLGIQNKMFNIGAYLATLSTPDNPADLYGLDADDIRALEQQIDTLDAETPPVRAFVLPGGSPLAAHAHVARTVCRRAERRIYDLAQTETVSPVVTRYINRLSDLLFIMARYFNHITHTPEITWHKE